MTIYAEEDYLQLSGIQHFLFCRRQWALIHLEQQWAENLRTVEGTLMHERAHDEGFSERRGGVMTVRGMRIASPTLGVSGACDVVEFREDAQGTALAGYEGRWRPYPVEYKRGQAKEHDADRLQLCCQAMCLEEMLAVDVPEGSLFYGESKRRERVQLDKMLRDQVRDILQEMHSYASRGYTPKVKTGAFCRACSLNELCLPKLCRNLSVSEYLRRGLEDNT